MKKRTVVLPFGCPKDAKGIGVGIAALVHGLAQGFGEPIALAQLHSRESKKEPVEALVPPPAWRDLAAAGNAPEDVSLVITGAWDPPVTGHGQVQVLAFDPKSGEVRASIDRVVEAENAGFALSGAMKDLLARVEGDGGALAGIDDLGWEPMESLLLGERNALMDASRGGPHDSLAAMAHLGRALADAPSSTFIAARLARVAFEASPRFMEPAQRALERALDDAPDSVDLAEALAAAETRLGRPRDAELRMNAVIARHPQRPRAHAILAEALRARGNLAGALAAIDAGLIANPGSSALLVERGVLLAEGGDEITAAATWRAVLDRNAHDVHAFVNLAALATRHQDAVLAQSLVDGALAHARTAPAELLARALQLSLVSEPEGIARSARIAELARAILDREPHDPWALVALGRARADLGDRAGALEAFRSAEELAPLTTAAAEAQGARLALQNPEQAARIADVARAAAGAPPEELEQVAAQARRLAVDHGAWGAWVALGVAERRRGRHDAAKHALESALAVAPGSVAAHVELASLCAERGDQENAVRHAEDALALEGETPRVMDALARARGTRRSVPPPRSLLARLWARWK
jgi:tetratricopeptide (TPR) repeat protein